MPAAPVVPSQPWPGSTPPAGPPPWPGLAGATPTPAGGATGWRRARWVVLGAVLALVGVAAAATLYLTRDRYPDLTFDSLRELARLSAGVERPVDMWTAVLDDRAYLAFPLPDDRLEVVAVDAGDGRELWREQTDVRADDWEAIIAVPGAVAVLADAPGDSTPDRWPSSTGVPASSAGSAYLRGDDDVYFADDTAVLVDRTADELVGLRLTNGSAKWTQPNPRGQYTGGRTVVRPVGTDAAAGGPPSSTARPETRGRARGGDWSRWVRTGRCGCSTWHPARCCASGASVADLDELVVAHEDRLYVAANEGGYQLLAYDLGSDAEPVVLHRSGNDEYRPKELVACGAASGRACCRCPRTTWRAPRWWRPPRASGMISWSAPGVTGLVPLGEQVLAQPESPEPIVTVFDAAGKPVLRDRGGVAVRLDGGNLLVFAKAPSLVADNRVLAGVWAESGEVDELGELKDVRSSSCSWNTHVIACGAEKDFVLYRFVDD